VKTIVVNRWRCAELPDAEIVALVQRQRFSRLALCLSHVTHLQSPLHLPDDDVHAELVCMGYLCATGQACSLKKPWLLGYLFPGFEEVANAK
jgi:hypothetical protein